MKIKVNRSAGRRFEGNLAVDTSEESQAVCDDFVDILQNSEEGGMREGTVAPGLIQGVNKDYVLVCIGSKSEGKIPRREFFQDLQEGALEVGSKINVFLEKIENKAGIIVLSREKALRYEMWDSLEKRYNDSEEVEGTIISSIKSGCIVDLGNILAFLPGSHVDLKVVKDISQFIGKQFQFKILKMDKKQGNIVVSRRVVLNSVNAGAKEEFLSSLELGQVVEGVVKSITNYGIFVGIHESNEVGVVDGLVHITDISWSRVSHPSAFYSYGQTIQVCIIKIDKEHGRVSLGIKQLVDNPWDQVAKNFAVGTKTVGCITSVEEYGVFVELSPGIEGLVHLSEISWVRSNRSFSRGQEVEIKVIAIDSERCRMSLSIKQCLENPWQKFLGAHPLGSKVVCRIKSIIDSGIVVSFGEPEFKHLEGFIRNADISDDPAQFKQIKRQKAGDELAGKLLQVNTNKGAISLGIKQLVYDPFEKFLSIVKEGDVLEGTIIKIDGRGIQVRITNDIVIHVPQEAVGDISLLATEQQHRFVVRSVKEYSLGVALLRDEDDNNNTEV